MIGVIANQSDLAVVREFFQLFKTPWELWQTGKHYSIVLSACPGAPLPDADLIIAYGSDSCGPKDQLRRSDQPRPGSIVLRYRDTRFPVYLRLSTFEGQGKTVIVREDTNEVVGFETAGPNGKSVRIGYDLFREIRFLLSVGQPKEYAEIPTLEIHIAILRTLIVESGLPLAEIPPVPPGYEFILCLTHDVDFVGIRRHRLDRTVLGFIYRATIVSLLRFVTGQLAFGGFLRNLLAVISLPMVYSGLLRDPFDQFEQYLRIEGDLKSTFFLVPYKHIDGLSPTGRKSKGRATAYDVDDIRAEIAAILAKGCEIGLHGLDAWHDQVKAEEEREKLRQATGSYPTGLRIHWLFFSEGTPQVLEKAGFDYDSTCGYNDCLGFRAGTAQVFRPPEVERLLELPLHVQDTALFSSGRMDLTQEQGIQAIEEMVGKTRTTGGVLTVNWHMRSLGPERLWGDPYRYLLRLAENRDVWTAGGREVVAWFAQRRSAEFAEIDLERGRLRATSPESRSLPGLVLKWYNRPGSDRSIVEYTPWSGSVEFAR